MRRFRSSAVGLAMVLLPLSAAVAQEGASGIETEPAGGVAARRLSDMSVTLEVSLSERVLRVVADDSLVRSYPVAVGQPQYPTPRGSFSIGRMVWNPRWVPPDEAWARGKKPRAPGDPNNPMGRVKLFFKEPDYYIHGTDKEETIGQAASHGCIRMANADVVELAQLVMEIGGESRPPDWFHRVVNAVRDTREVRLSAPVRFRVVP